MAPWQKLQKRLNKMLSRDQPAKKFEYQPLPSATSIRTLELLPGLGQQPIRCRLITTDLETAADTYTGLSYVWGDSKKEVGILCNGRGLEVTTSLASALLAVRHPRETVQIWADAICINQDDDAEKSQQVNIMNKVFENAAEVVAWLGPDHGGVAKNCFDLIRQTNKHLDTLLEIHDGWNRVPISRQEICFDQERWDDVLTLICLPWFERVWVIQEAALAKRCHLLWGEQRMDIAELCEISLWLGFRSDLDVRAGTGDFGNLFSIAYCTYRNPHTWRTSKPLIRLQEDLLNSQHWSLFHLLDATRLLQVSRNVDRIYAFLGNPLARTDDGTAPIVKSDYSKSADEVYFEAAAALLGEPRTSSCVLGFALHTSNADLQNPHFPSWVPRWEKSETHYHMVSPSSAHMAGGPGRHFKATIQEDKSLSASGVVFDKIQWTSDTIHAHNLELNANRWDIEFRQARKPFVDHLWESLDIAFRSLASPPNADRLHNLGPSFALALTRDFPSNSNERHFDPDRLWVQCAAYRDALRYNVDPARGRVDADTMVDANLYLDEIYDAHFKSLCLTESGSLGLVPMIAQPGDRFCVFPGLPTPMVLRPWSDNKYKLVGEAYLNGVMQGEVITKLEEGAVESETIVIV